MEEKEDYIMELFANLTDENIERCKKRKKQSEYTTIDFINDIIDKENKDD